MQYELPVNADICALLPIYTTNGDHTKVLTTDGAFILPVKISTVVRRLARRQTIDLCALKAKTSKLTNMTIWQPLVLAPDLVLAPFKTRKPKISGDATGGYINYHHILEIKGSQNVTEFVTSGGHTIVSLWRKTTIDDHLQKTKLAYLSFSRQESAQKAFLKDKLFRIWFENTANNPEKFFRLYALHNV